MEATLSIGPKRSIAGWLFAACAMREPDGRRLRRRGCEELTPAGERVGADGRLATKTDFKGLSTSFNYDLAGRMISRSAPGEQAVTWTYRNDGLRESMDDASGLTRWRYDARKRLARKEHSAAGNLSYEYDAGGNLTRMYSDSATSGGVSMDYTYDDLNRLKEARRGTDVTTYGYDNNGNLETVAYPSTNGVTSTYEYDAVNRLAGMEAKKGSSTIRRYDYELRPNGMRDKLSESGGTTRTSVWDYDHQYRLISENISNSTVAGLTTYEYDKVGNRKKRLSVPAITELPPQDPSYDVNDRMTSRDEYDPNGNTTRSGSNFYAYDSNNRLTSLKLGSPAAAEKVSVVYDGDGNRIQKTVDGVTTTYLVDTNSLTGYAQVVEEKTGGTLTKVYLYGLDLIAQIDKPSDTLHYFGYDGLGSTRYLTDVNGAVTENYNYDSFGTLLGFAGTPATKYLYTGEQFDADLGMYFLRARYYEPSGGRFISRDTWEGVQTKILTLHPYTYGDVNPIEFVDPSGHATIYQELFARFLGRNGSVAAAPTATPSPSPTATPVPTPTFADNRRSIRNFANGFAGGDDDAQAMARIYGFAFQLLPNDIPQAVTHLFAVLSGRQGTFGLFRSPEYIGFAAFGGAGFRPEYQDRDASGALLPRNLTNQVRHFTGYFSLTYLHSAWTARTILGSQEDSLEFAIADVDLGFTAISLGLLLKDGEIRAQEVENWIQTNVHE